MVESRQDIQPEKSLAANAGVANFRVRLGIRFKGDEQKSHLWTKLVKRPSRIDAATHPKLFVVEDTRQTSDQISLQPRFASLSPK